MIHHKHDSFSLSSTNSLFSSCLNWTLQIYIERNSEETIQKNMKLQRHLYWSHHVHPVHPWCYGWCYSCCKCQHSFLIAIWMERLCFPFLYGIQGYTATAFEHSSAFISLAYIAYKIFVILQPEKYIIPKRWK